MRAAHCAIELPQKQDTQGAVLAHEMTKREHSAQSFGPSI